LSNEELEKPFTLLSPAFNCIHKNILIDESLNEVQCKNCKEKLNPIWVLARFAKEGNRYEMAFSRIKKTLEKADKKNMCKCQHCKKMTLIQR